MHIEVSWQHCFTRICGTIEILSFIASMFHVLSLISCFALASLEFCKCYPVFSLCQRQTTEGGCETFTCTSQTFSSSSSSNNKKHKKKKRRHINGHYYLCAFSYRSIF
ncbi:hypothetical protein AAC387_Pa06g1507 [Persea americana]